MCPGGGVIWEGYMCPGGGVIWEGYMCPGGGVIWEGYMCPGGGVISTHCHPTLYGIAHCYVTSTHCSVLCKLLYPCTCTCLGDWT